MPVKRIPDTDVGNLSIAKSKDSNYIREGLKSLELQIAWLKFGKFPLPNKKFVKELDTSITLTVPIEKDDELYTFFEKLDNFVASQNLCSNKKQNKFIKQRDDRFFIKIKLYITTNVFIVGNNEPISKKSIMDYYNYFKDGTEARVIFSLGKMYEINNEYGFPIYALRVQLKELPTNTVSFSSDTD